MNISTDWLHREIEIAVWAPPDAGKRSGHYGCFRVFFKGGEVLSAVLFCYYDGTEGSPGFTSREKGASFRQTTGFYLRRKEWLN